MHAHDEPAKTDRRTRPQPETRPGTRPEPVHPAGGCTAQRMSTAQLLVLQRTVGNAAAAEAAGAAGSAGAGGGPGPLVRSVLASPGRPLDEPARADLETRLGADFSDVRVHTDATAQRSAAALGARAYTSGSHVVLGAGGTDGHTLAHELTHVIQQRSGPVAGTDDGTGLRISDPADRFEREAEATARRVMAAPLPATGAGAPQPAGTAATPAGDRSGARTGATQRAAARGGQQIQRFQLHQENGVNYRLSQTGLFAIIDGDRRVWADAAAPVSPALARNPNGDRTINGRLYHEYQTRRWLLADCLHTAEEIINDAVGELKSARELTWDQHPATEGRYSRIPGKGSAYRQFGKGDRQNKADALAFTRPKNENAAPRIGEAFVILRLTDPSDPNVEMSPYHAAAVVGVDGNDRVTLEEWDDRGQSSRGGAKIYTVGDASLSFHGVWGTHGEGGRSAYFEDVSPITVTITGVANQNLLIRRTNAFDVNTFGDEPDRTLPWPAED